jgi:aspartate kinase
MAGKIFKNLANHGISIDLISILPDRKIFTVDNGSSRVTSDILKQYSLNYHKQDHLVKVSVIGCRMRGVPGIMAKIIRSFSENGIEILQTADSHNSISCLVKEKDYEKAVKLLYNIFRV